MSASPPHESDPQGEYLMEQIQPERRQCTAKSKQSGERCKRYPVPGGTVCVIHGGRTPGARKTAAANLAKAEASLAVARFGGSLDMHPAEALLQLVGAKAAEVAYWSERVTALQDDEALTWGMTARTEGTSVEKGHHHETTESAAIAVALDQLHIAQRDLKDFAAASLKAGVDAARVKLQREQAQQAVAILRAALADPRIAATTDIQQAVMLDAIRAMQTG